MLIMTYPTTRPLSGRVRVPGDKSISHRAVLFGAMAEGTTRVSGVLDSADVRSTVAAVTALGASVWLEHGDDGALAGEVTGWGERGPASPDAPIDCGNSGTTARLLLGVLAGWDATVTLVGDESLSRRPMARVTDPLTAMGGRFETETGTLPITVRGMPLVGRDYASPVASAQVKTALLLAGLRADGRTTVTEPAPSRDHTERLLPAFGVAVGRAAEHNAAWVDGPARMLATHVEVPGDPSSAAFWAVAACIVPGSEVTIEGMALNPTRTGFLAVLERMGADVSVAPGSTTGAEAAGDVTVRAPDGLLGTTVTAQEVPSLIDEIPVLAIAAACARGTTVFDGVAELRVKESDRLAAIAEGLGAMGVTTRAGHATLEIDGVGSDTRDSVAQAGRLESGRLGACELDSLGDHRLAMSWAVAGLASDRGITVRGFEAVDVSYPRFLEDLARLRGE